MWLSRWPSGTNRRESTRDAPFTSRALVYDPELTQTHQKLVSFEYEDYLTALLDADLKRQQKDTQTDAYLS